MFLKVSILMLILCRFFPIFAAEIVPYNKLQSIMVSLSFIEQDLILDALCQYRNQLLDCGNKSRADLCLGLYNSLKKFF